MSKIITIDDLNTFAIGKSLDPGLGQIVVDQVNAYIETVTNRCFGETKTATERVDWRPTTYLRRMDVQSISQVQLGSGYQGASQTTVDGTRYYLGSGSQLNYFAAPRQGYRDYMTVTYTYGVPTVPNDLKAAALGIAAGMYSWTENGQRDVSSVSVGTYQISYTNKRMSADATPDAATSSADANFSIINAYRQRRV